ncbi:MAG: phenylalanine--tRNA ligase subunit alpha [Nitrososphaerota archaeon]
MSRQGAENIELHPLEKRVLSLILSEGPLGFDEVAARLGVNVGAVAKSAEWLAEKGLAESSKASVTHVATLGEEGLVFVEKGLPERRLVDALRSMGGEATLAQIEAMGILDKNELNIGIIWAKRNGWITVSKSDNEVRFRLERYPDSKTDEELVLEVLKRGAANLEDMGPLQKACERLGRRPRILRINEVTRYILTPTKKALSLSPELLEETEEISQLTPELISSGAWRERGFRRYDVTTPVKAFQAPRPHPLTYLIQLVKSIFIELGFEEVQGPLVELAFWNFDALFQPQDHPAREMHDTFYLATPAKGDPPKELSAIVGRVHRDGGETGSRGWGYEWSIEEASRLVLRTHTTATTIRHLAQSSKRPLKVFTIDRVYRNERVDWRRLAEFHQVEGILVDKSANLRQLMGLIREFYSRLGLKKVRFRPSYFPYTEPSAEVDVYVERRGSWVELGGMGIFRPEVTLPLEVSEPVLAWGLGLERLALLLLDVNDARILYQNDLRWLYSFNPLKLERLRVSF